MVRFWNIDITDIYFNQVSSIPIEIHRTIEEFIQELTNNENPRNVGSSYSCPTDDFILTIYPGLPYEFIYEINNIEKTITLINCERLRFLDYAQPETI